MYFSYFLMTVLMFSGLFLIGLILLQRGRGGGLAGAFGGMGGQSAFGTKAGDVFTRITIGVAAAWILLCAGSVLVLRNASGGRTDPSVFKDDTAAVKKDVDFEDVDLPTVKSAPADGQTTSDGSVEKKDESVKTEEKKPEEPKVEEKKPEGEVKPDGEKKLETEAKPEAEKKAEEKKAEEPAKPAESKVEDPKPAEPKPAEPKPEAPSEKKPE
jgi:preprotein translocase subunit SecG